jgi:2-polyprenyl-3-methyl-5-hydroxy-6-metoxy-1,4-benzoquinol methylase
MINYDLDPAAFRPSSTHATQINLVPEGSYVLDVGCYSGILGSEMMKRKHAKVIGVDYEKEAVLLAKEKLADAFTIDLEDRKWANSIKEKGYSGFDLINFGDVLEHTRFPERILEEAKSLLKQDGSILVSIPNIAYWRVRLGILFGRFDYTDSGILDRTHLRFFTRRTVRALVENAGYEVTDFLPAAFSLPRRLLQVFPGLLGFQFVIRAKKKG